MPSAINFKQIGTTVELLPNALQQAHEKAYTVNADTRRTKHCFGSTWRLASEERIEAVSQPNFIGCCLAARVKIPLTQDA
jgi:hypothetical protein